MRIGVISDTHGYLDPRAAAALQGVAAGRATARIVQLT